MTRARDNADLGDSYGALGAGVTGGSGLTALGTVTVGNLSHADIVFPVGHVIQCITYNRTGTGANTNSAYDLNSTNTTQLEITVKDAGSKMLIMHHSSHVYKQTSGSGNVYMKRTIVSGASAEIGQVQGRFNFTANAARSASIMTIDTHGQAVDTVIQYYVRLYSTADYMIWGDDSSTTNYSGYVMEIVG